MNHMNLKTVGLLGLAAVIAIAAAVALNAARQSATETASQKVYALPELQGHVNDVTGLRITGSEDKRLVTLAKSDQGWRVTDKGDYPADTGKLRALLLKLSDAQLIEPKTANEQRYAELGVDDPKGKDAKGVLVTVEGLGKPADLIVGNAGSRGDGTFVRRSGEKQSWLAKGDLTVEKEASEWLEKSLVDIPAERIREVLIIRPDGKTVRVYKEQVGDANFRLADVPKGRTLMSDGAPNSLAEVLGQFALEDVVPPQSGEGPGDRKTHKARYTTFDGLILEIDFWKRDDKPYARLNASLDQTLADSHIAAEQSKAKAQYESQQKDDLAAKPAQDQSAGAGDTLTKAIGEKSLTATPPLAVADPATDRRQRLDKLNAEAATLKARFSGWTFVLPASKFSELDKTVDAFLKSADAGLTPGSKRRATTRK